MQIRVADYIASFLVENEIDTVFSVVGGGAMHLNDALGHKDGLRCIYNHHEQASAIAAESYARAENKIAAVCVTTGPGGTNAITGVVGGYLDSIPMLVISGQVRYDNTPHSTGLPLRSLGDQEFDIVMSIACMTKYSEMVIDPARIRYCLEKALYCATHGRPGPSWIDIPLNIQAALIDPDMLAGYDPAEYKREYKESIDDSVFETIISKLKEAKRPVIYAGSAVRYAGAHAEFLKLIQRLGVPVVDAWNAIDCLEYDNPLYVGIGGSLGDRAGNYAVQNSDCILSLGCRLSIRQVGFNYSAWAREAYTIVIDIDEVELKKPTIRVDLPVNADVGYVIRELLTRLENQAVAPSEEWLKVCLKWKQKYPVVLEKHRSEQIPNIYNVLDRITTLNPAHNNIVVGNGSAAACIHAYKIKKGQRFFVNSAIASMGYDLPAAIGACFANEKKKIVLITGDGSIQMNIQELQTVVHHKLPIVIFLINNQGYHSIRQTQKNFFGEPLVGIGEDSHDLSFPDMSRIAYAYGISYIACKETGKLDEYILKALNGNGSVICEMFVSLEQGFEPKASSKRLPDGSMISAPLEDMYPFLPDGEQKENMFVRPANE